MIRASLSPFQFILILFLFFVSTTVYAAQPATAVGGLLDLRAEHFESSVELNGQWKFYWNKLLSPKAAANSDNPELVDFPFLWHGNFLNGEELPSFGYATYTLTILLPESSPPLSLGIPDMYSAYRLYLNNQVVAENGKVGTSKEDFIPYWQTHTVNIPENVDTIHLTLQIANFEHSKAGISNDIVIGKADSMALRTFQFAAIDLLLTGCLLMSGLYFLGLFIMGNRDKAILMFALYSIVFSYRIIGVGDYTLHSVLPGISWYITIRLEYMSLFAGIGIFALYTNYLYPEASSHRLPRIVYTLCFLFAFASLTLPPYYFTQLINPFLLLMAFCLIYVPYIYTRAYLKKLPGSVYALMSAIAVLIVFGISLLYYWGIAPKLQLLNFLSYVAFFFLQSLVLSHRVSFQLKKARLEAEQGLISKTEFLSTMSHEIRTPLNSVIGMSHLLLKNNPRKDQIEHLDVMLFSANNLLSIVNDILDYSKIEAGKVSFEQIEMNAAAIVRNIVTSLQASAQDKGIELTLHSDPNLPYKLIGDPTRLSQVITNLVHNAIKFTEVGKVQVSLYIVEENENSVTLKFQVKDSGIGISKEKHKLIFERFTQADSSTSRGFGGTGLGLAITKKILELQNSTLELVSEEGKGSEFYFTQTFGKSTLKETELKKGFLPEESYKPLNGINILLVEDNKMNVLVAQSFLQRWGATIDVAVNGLEALHKLNKEKHHLILMDLHMPIMDGYEATIRLRQQGVHIPIIALTANLPNEIDEKLKEVGINNVVVKPFLPDELYRTILHHVS
ncbi:signal transduction histidine kinase [Arcticibacter pallidicorallinus]|uniref:histidine kinase n=2 Tax=Arcticibacter pallidicorallinus TaxID=1259464 RepID=A0A2T0TRJ0_9SPHI|nr:signal transduction histidine kinase [Arcticibacter pallidicorallinus]